MTEPNLRVLVVCTANVCRSPAAAMLLQHHTGHLGVVSSSAGVAAAPGTPICAYMAARLAERGIDPTGFRARRLSERHIAEADLILGATEQHVAQVVELDPTALRRVATLRQFADWVSQVPDLEVPETVAAALALRGSHAPRHGLDWEIPDPVGQGATVHRQVWDSMNDALSTIAQAWGRARV